MLQQIAACACFCALFAASAAAQLPKYLDIFTVKINPEKYGDFMAGAKKIADANRRHQGDYFLAWAVEYGEPAIMFVSPRNELGEVERAMDMFRKAAGKAFGAGAEKVMYELIGSSREAHGEIRLYRWDLTRHAPAGQEEIARTVGAARWVRTITLRVKPEGRGDFEALMTETKAAMEKADPEPVFISESYIGQEGSAFYVTHMAPSLSELDKRPAPHQMLGEENYRDFMKRLGANVISTRITLARAVPELSNPPEPVVNVSRDFWTPKPAMSTAARKAKK